jgi:hypothetical protein
MFISLLIKRYIESYYSTFTLIPQAANGMLIEY